MGAEHFCKLIYQKLLFINFLQIPFSEPSINDHIIFKLYDWDMGQKDELVGSSSFSKKDVLTGKVHSFSFFYIKISLSIPNSFG